MKIVFLRPSLFLAVMLSCALLAVAWSPPAFAQDGAVTVPWGDWVAGVLSYLRDGVIAIVVAMIGLLAKNLSPGIRDMILAARVEQLLTRAADYGVAAVAGAVKGKTLDVRVTNEVLEKAAEYAVANAPALAEKLGATLRPKLLARLAPIVGPEVSAEFVNAQVAP